METFSLLTRRNLAFQFLRVFTYFVEFTVLPLFQKFCVNHTLTVPKDREKHHHPSRQRSPSHKFGNSHGFRSFRASGHNRTRLIAQILLPAISSLFPKLKDYLKGNRYETDEDVKNAVLSWCRDKTADFFADGIQQVIRRWRLCIERDG